MSIVRSNVVPRRRGPYPYLVSEDFEGAGTPPGWLAVGGANFDYTTSPIVGAQSLFMTTGQQAYTRFSPSRSEAWAFCRVRRAGTPTAVGSSIFNFLSGEVGSFVIVCSVSSHTVVNVWRCSVGTAATNTTISGSENTDLAVWMRYVKGTGANARGEFYFVVGNENRPAATVTITTGTSTTNAEWIYCQRPTGVNVVFDKIRVSANPILSNPF